MKVQTVTVEIHEKRNHPNEYGHYDARVAYTVEVEHAEDPANVVSTYQFLARQQVAAECDHWIAEIERKRMVGEAKYQLNLIIDRAEDGNLRKDDPDKFELHLIPLAEHERAEFNAKFVAAKEGYWAAMRNRLNADIESVESGKPISDYNLKVFYQLLDNLPADEREDFRNSMLLALAPKAEVPLAENEEDIPY